MSAFAQVLKTYRQHNLGTPAQVFPLLCPVREKDWLDGWEYEMIYSRSGLAEENCVFITPHHGPQPTVWTVTRYEPNEHIEFVRHTPGENLVRIEITLHDNGDGTTATDIAYRYTALSEPQNQYLREALDGDFANSMAWWERAINHYLRTGEMLRRVSG